MQPLPSGCLGSATLCSSGQCIVLSLGCAVHSGWPEALHALFAAASAVLDMQPLPAGCLTGFAPTATLLKLQLHLLQQSSMLKRLALQLLCCLACAGMEMLVLPESAAAVHGALLCC